MEFNPERRKLFAVAVAASTGVSLSPLAQKLALAAQGGWINLDFNHPDGPWRYVEAEFDPLERRLWSNESLRHWFPIIPQLGLPTIEGPLRNLDRIYQIITSEPGSAWDLEKPGHESAAATRRLDYGHCFDAAKLILQRPEPTPHFEPELGETIGLVDKLGWLVKLHSSDGWYSLRKQAARSLLESGEPLITRRDENGQIWDRLIIAISGNRVQLTNFGARFIEADFNSLIGIYSPIYMYGDRGYDGINPPGKGRLNEFVVQQKGLILRLCYPQLYNFAPLTHFVH